jgi:hypothetical protein
MGKTVQSLGGMFDLGSLVGGQVVKKIADKVL